MIHTKRDLVDFLTNNAAWRWEVERLEQKISALQGVLIEAGVLVNAKGVDKSIIVVDGEQYSIRKVK